MGWADLWSLEFTAPTKGGIIRQMMKCVLAVSLSPVGESSVSVEMFMDGNKETKFLSTINTNDIELNTQPSDLVAGSYLGWLDDLRCIRVKRR